MQTPGKNEITKAALVSLVLMGGFCFVKLLNSNAVTSFYLAIIACIDYNDIDDTPQGDLNYGKPYHQKSR